MNPSSSAAPSDAASAPHLAPEAASPTPFGAPAAFGPASGSGKGKTIALICVSALAIVGLAFGAFEFSQNLKLTAESAVNNTASLAPSSDGSAITTVDLEVTNPDGSVAGLQTDEFSIKDGVVSVVYSDPTVTLSILPEGTAISNPTEYIYIGAWNMKIQQPDNWRDMVASYTLHNDYPHAVDTFEITETTTSASIKISQGASLENASCADDEWSECVIVSITNSEHTAEIRLPKSSPVSDAFRAWITNPENYSTI